METSPSLTTLPPYRRPLCYTSQTNILRNLPFHKRRELCRFAPGLRAANRKLPYQFGIFRMTEHERILIDFKTVLHFQQKKSGVQVALRVYKELNVKMEASFETVHKCIILNATYESVVNYFIRFLLDRPGTVVDVEFGVVELKWFQNFENPINARSRYVDDYNVDVFKSPAKIYGFRGIYTIDYMMKFICHILNLEIGIAIMVGGFEGRKHISDIMRGFQPKHCFIYRRCYRKGELFSREEFDCIRVELKNVNEKDLIFVNGGFSRAGFDVFMFAVKKGENGCDVHL